MREKKRPLRYWRDCVSDSKSYLTNLKNSDSNKINPELNIYPHITPEVCTYATLWMTTGWDDFDTETFWYRLIFVCDWQMKASVWTVNWSLLMRPPVQWKFILECWQAHIFKHTQTASLFMLDHIPYLQPTGFFLNQSVLLLHNQSIQSLFTLNECFSNLSQIHRWEIICFQVNLQSMATY